MKRKSLKQMAFVFSCLIVTSGIFSMKSDWNKRKFDYGQGDEPGNVVKRQKKTHWLLSHSSHDKFDELNKQTQNYNNFERSDSTGVSGGKYLEICARSKEKYYIKLSAGMDQILPKELAERALSTIDNSLPVTRVWLSQVSRLCFLCKKVYSDQSSLSKHLQSFSHKLAGHALTEAMQKSHYDFSGYLSPFSNNFMSIKRNIVNANETFNVNQTFMGSSNNGVVLGIIVKNNLFSSMVDRQPIYVTSSSKDQFL